MPDEETLVTFNHMDYGAIEAAVMETARGRWFLREYAKRNRNADTEAVLAAVAGLEKKLVEEKAARTMDQIRASLLDMASAIGETKADIGLCQPEERDAPVAAPDSGPEETARRIARILKTLRYLEERIHAMMDLCDPEQPLADKEPPSRDVVDFVQARAASPFLN
ncbi:hypothetical protein [Microvirga sp. 2TAF3]|uniref:hypothetical protein n=1 Tax=Microvirga sp. 2TAF3 TaxID=3233014 RepID=UPI003F94B00A